MAMRGDIPSRKKVAFPVREMLKEYLEYYGRYVQLPIHYDDLMRYSSTLPLIDSAGKDTLWETVFYDPADTREFFAALTNIYGMMLMDGDTEALEHLTIDRIDYCTFGNTHPFRIRVINRLNDNYDHFYVKKTDASRIYGLELEHLLSPNPIHYYVSGNTMIEAHIPGLPGDDFMKNNLSETPFNEIRIAKEFVKFNERCFVLLLGDMRSYNYVVDITPDIEGNQYRMRPIDFDQQSYEGKKSFYLPQYFKENNPIIFLGIKHMKAETVRQYQLEERSLIAMRYNTHKKRCNDLLAIMIKDEISFPDKIEQLKEELGHHHNTNAFDACKSMGEVLLTNLELLLKKDFKQSIQVV